jgi:signal recognition particle subunit SRP19
MGKKAGGRVRVKQLGPKGGMGMGNPMDEMMVAPEDMIQLPPPVDKSMSHIWPISETFTMKYATFSVIYPNYLDAKKTVKQGRRISAVEAVDSPTVMDIGATLQSMGVRHVVQPYKGYSRDTESQWDNLGRVLVDIPKNGGFDVMEIGTDGAFDVDGNGNVEAKSKKQLLREISARVPQLASRKQRLAREQAEREADERRAIEEVAAAHKTASLKASTNTGGSNKKKNKGKKKK